MYISDMIDSFQVYNLDEVWAHPEGDTPDSAQWPVLRVRVPVACAGCGRVVAVDELMTPHEQSMLDWCALVDVDKDAAAFSFYSPNPDKSFPYCFDCWPVSVTRMVYERPVSPGAIVRSYAALPDAYEVGGSKFAKVDMSPVRPGRSRGPGRQPRRGPAPSRRGRFRPHS